MLFMVRACFLACRQLPSLRVLIEERERERESKHACKGKQLLCSLVFFFSLFKILIYFIIYLAVPGSLVVP